MTEPSNTPPEETPERRHWRRNIRLVAFLLTIWFLVSYGAGILFREPLDEASLGGFPLGFWFAQQGAIYVFVVLIFVYSWRMNRLEKALGLYEEDDDEPADGEP